VSYLANDFVLLEDNCNLSCGYCLTGQSKLKKRHSLKMIFEPPRKTSCQPGTELKDRADRVLAQMERQVPLPIIKVTGGEIFLIRGILDFLAELSARYATVVIQTNGMLLDAHALSEMKRWGNVCLQLSIDAFSFEGNAYRTPTAAIHASALRQIESALDAEIPTEVYCVLNDRSVPALGETMEWLMPWSNHAVLAPFPVRGPEREKFATRREQLPELRSLLADPRFAALLPPRPYIDRLVRFLDEGERTFRCHLPRLAFTTFDDGVVTPCPNIWFMELGNVLSAEPEKAIERLGASAFYELLLAQRPRIDACKQCFTPWDLLSLFLDGEISLDEVCRTPMYSAPASRARLAEIKAGLAS
jgi:MoaA/NifB/PqqE/SkfB family radical SAM enzyme